MLRPCKYCITIVILRETDDLQVLESRAAPGPSLPQNVRTDGVRNYNPASILDLGSRRARNASPIKLKESAASITVTAGKSTRCGASNRCERASFSIDPQLAVGGGTPNPKKLIVASARMVPAMPMAACTITG